MRRHGWQLPYHPLQIVAMAVFFALVFAFYVFFAPFVGSKLLEIVVIAMYSSSVVVVFALYVWCVAVDPGDNGLLHLRKCNSPSPTKSRPSSSTVSLGVEGKDIEMSTAKQSDQRCAASSFDLCGNLFCKGDAGKTPIMAEMLYCSLCKVEISMDSKHCRVCDKCITGFDHHCRWLNNCVGQKNYKDFVALMVSGIAMLILQWTVGLWILVHCFSRITYFKGVVDSKLGNSFSFIAYVSVVGFCTLLAMAATYPLTQLFFFHILLIKKGISTYDYIVAMREQDSKAIGETIQSSSSSPVSSMGTTPSIVNSTGTLQGKAWCTPPRLLLDHEQGIYLPERSFPVKDSSSGLPSKIEYDRKRSVKLDPWALAALSKSDIVRSAMEAKKQSSILRPVPAKHEKPLIHQSLGSMSSSRDVNKEYVHPTSTIDSSKTRGDIHRNLAGQAPSSSFVNQETFSAANFDGDGSDSGDIIQLARRARKMLNPLQMEAMNAFKSSHAFSGTTVSSPDSCGTSDDAHASPSPYRADLFPGDLPQSQVPCYWRYNARGSESAESDGDVSSPCTPIGQMMYNAQKAGFRS